MAKKEGKKDACYHKVKSRYSVWPSAYASGALVKCRKVGAKNWGTKSEDMEFYNLISDYLIEEGFAYDENSVDDVILKLDESLLIQIYERKMTKSEKKKETKLKGKYDDSAMKQNMINQYGKEEGEKIYFATIRKQAMGEGVNFNHPIDPNRKTRTERDKKIEDAADSGQPNAPKILSKRGKGPSLPGRTQDMRKKALGEDKYSDLSKHAARMNLLNNPGPRSTPEETAEKKAKLEKKRGMKLDDHPQFKKEEVEHVDEAFPKVPIARSIQKELGYQDKIYQNKDGSRTTFRVKIDKEGNKQGVIGSKTVKGKMDEEVDTRRAPAELVARLSAKIEGEMAQDGPNKAAYDAKQRILKKTHEKMKKVKEEVDINPAVDYFFSEGINEDGLEMIIQEVGLEKFVEFVEYFSDQELLTEARSAKRRKGGKSYEEVKAEIDAKEKAKRAKREISVDKGTKAVETAKAKQPEKKPVRDAIARGVFGAVKAYQSGMERHRKAMELAKETGKTVAKAAAVTHEAGRRAGESKVGQAVKKAGSAAIKAGVEKAKKDIQSLKKEEVELSEAPFQVYDMRDKVNVGKEMKNKKRARTKADNLDQEYGGYRYKVIPTGDDRPEVKYGTTKEEVEIGEELHPNVKKIDAISKQRVQQKAADAQRARERMASSTAAFQAHKKEVIAKGGTPVDALDSWQKKKMKKEEVEVKVEESTKLFYKLQAKGKGRSSTAKAQTTRDSNLEDQKSAKMRRQQAKQRQEREGDDKYGHPSLSAAERNPSMR